jgi:MYXO-CTERM domain-containing protein
MNRARLVLVVAASAAAACAVAPGGETVPEKLGRVSSPIIGGVVAGAYPEAALVDLLRNGQQVAACSGVVIAPQVVLTAGHCIGGATEWNVTTPYAGNQSVHGSNGAVYDYYPPVPTDTVDPSFHDIGLVFLDSPIVLDQYPIVAAQPLPFGSPVVNIGRIQDGTFSTTDLFVGPQVQISDGTPFGYAYDYAATDVIESGDSGGPVEAAGGGGSIVVAVNSGGGGGDVEVLARVDLVYGWIQQQVQANGGGGNDAGITPDYASTGDDAGGGYGVQSDDAGGGNEFGASTTNGPTSSGSGSGCSVAAAPSTTSSSGWLLCTVVVLLARVRRRT